MRESQNLQGKTFLRREENRQAQPTCVVESGIESGPCYDCKAGVFALCQIFLAFLEKP